MRQLYISVVMILLVCSCSKKDIDAPSLTAGTNTTQITDTLSAVNYLNTSYGSSPQQAMDVYLPAARNPVETRTIVIIHGGGWTSGDKSQFNGYVTEFQKRLPQYAIVNMDYRLIKYDSTYFDMEEQDVISAMQFLKQKSADYNISQDVILLGSSAGGHLALLQGYKHTDILQPKGIISFFGPTDLSDLFFNYNDKSIPWVLQKILGGVEQENGQAYADASPVNFVNSNSAPTLMLHGEDDPLVPVHQAYELKAKLDSLHVRNELVVYPGAGHGWGEPDLTDSFDKIQAFISSL